MVKAFSVASWNVKHFRQEPENRVAQVISVLRKQDPDVFALYEVTGKDVFNRLTRDFPSYTFEITEGPQTQEILIGLRSTLTTFITQRLEFKAGVTLMRPGLLATISLDGANYVLLFLHLASSTKPRGMGLRDDMMYRAVKFRRVLDKAAGGKDRANYVFLGDLNIMGMDYPFEKDIGAELELEKWNRRASRYYEMRRLTKTHNTTWWGGSASSYEPADLDHVYASKHLKFKPFKDPHGNDAEVDVRGWVTETSLSARDLWASKYSDHSLLFFEVQKVSSL